MAQLRIPDSGLTLIERGQSNPADGPSKNNTGRAQVMQLDLTPSVLGELVRSARHGGKGVNVHFGKTIVSDWLNNH